MRIPIPKILRHWREESFDRKLNGSRARWALGLWAALATRPALYRLATGLAARVLKLLAGGKGRFKSLPLAAAWTRYRDLPAPQGSTFMAQYKGRR